MGKVITRIEFAAIAGISLTLLESRLRSFDDPPKPVGRIIDNKKRYLIYDDEAARKWIKEKKVSQLNLAKSSRYRKRCVNKSDYGGFQLPDIDFDSVKKQYSAINNIFGAIENGNRRRNYD